MYYFNSEQVSLWQMYICMYLEQFVVVGDQLLTLLELLQVETAAVLAQSSDRGERRSDKASLDPIAVHQLLMHVANQRLLSMYLVHQLLNYVNR